jgi:uncharacterized protein (TIRG00374 family)
MSKRKNRIFFALKFIFSFSILGYLIFGTSSIKDILNVLRQADVFWLVLSFSLHSLGLLISSIRWQILIKAQGDSVPLGFLAKSYLVGTFFNNFLPSRIGGDLVRIWDGSRYSQTLLKSSAIVLVERLTGIIILFLFAFSASLIRIDIAFELPIVWVSLVISFIGLAMIVLFLTPLASRIINKIPDKGILGKIRQKTLSFQETILVYKGKKAALLKAFFWAFLLQVNVIIHFFFIGKALKLPIDLLDYFIFIPIVLLIQLIPITINGLGLREGAYAEIFKFYIIPEPHAVAMAIAFSFIDVGFMLIVGIVGGIVYALRKTP